MFFCLRLWMLVIVMLALGCREASLPMENRSDASDVFSRASDSELLDEESTVMDVQVSIEPPSRREAGMPLEEDLVDIRLSSEDASITTLPDGSETESSVQQNDASSPMDVFLSDADALVSRDLFPLADLPPSGTAFSMPVRRLVTSCGMTCVVTTGGEVYCWGGTAYTSAGLTAEERRRVHRIDGLRNISDVSLSCFVGCAVDRGGRVWCWGENAGGVLGTGSIENPLRNPGVVSSVTNVTHIGTLEGRVFARRMDGMVFAWGGNLPRIWPPRSVVVPGFPVDLSSGSGGGGSNICMRLMDERFACLNIAPPDGTSMPATPTLIDPYILSGTASMTTIQGGSEHWCALKQDRTVWCWGFNRLGQVGISPEVSGLCSQRITGFGDDYTAVWRCQGTAVRVESLTNVEEIAPGVDSSCARLRDGTVWCWGGAFSFVDRMESFYTFGDGRMDGEMCSQPDWSPPSRTPPPQPCRRRPYRIPSLSGVTALAIGGDPGFLRESYGCAALSSGQVWCWGANNGGQLGDGTNTHRATPVAVRF